MRIGLIGYGSFGTQIAACLTSLEHTVTVIDTDRTRVTAAESDGHLGYHGEPARAFNDGRPVIIATPPDAPGRIELADTLLNNGNLVRLEKPAALTLAELDTLNAIDNGALTISHTALMHPAYRMMRAELEITPHLELRRIGPPPRHNISPWLDTGIHALAILADLGRLTNRPIRPIMHTDTLNLVVTGADTIVLGTDSETSTRQIASLDETGQPSLIVDELANTVSRDGLTWAAAPMSTHINPLRDELAAWLDPAQTESVQRRSRAYLEANSIAATLTNRKATA